MSVSYFVIPIFVLIVIAMIIRAWRESRASRNRMIDAAILKPNASNISYPQAKNSQLSSHWYPVVIPINREEHYHTHYIGYTKDGRQFFAYNTFYKDSEKGQIAKDWEHYRKEYVVLHIFTSSGDYIETKHWYAGTTAEISGNTIENKINELLSTLGTVYFGDIGIKPFSTVIDGVTFGLIPNEEFETIDLEPSSTISFHAPWDGDYDT